MGTKTVVLSSEAGGTMIHEAIGHGLEADLAMEGLSCYKGMLGESIASPLISVVDDATVPHLRGTYAYDDEGTGSERTVLVENGILKNFLFDKFHAADTYLREESQLVAGFIHLEIVVRKLDRNFVEVARRMERLKDILFFSSFKGSLFFRGVVPLTVTDLNPRTADIHFNLVITAIRG